MYYQRANQLQREILICNSENQIVCRINLQDYEFESDAYSFAEILVDKLNDEI